MRGTKRMAEKKNIEEICWECWGTGTIKDDVCPCCKGWGSIIFDDVEEITIMSTKKNKKANPG
jgi:DnaJ-class molecular chaperone